MIIKLVHKFEWETTNIYNAGYNHSNFCKSPWCLKHSLYNLTTCVHQAYQSYISRKPKLNVFHYKNLRNVATNVCVFRNGTYCLIKGYTRSKKCNITMWNLRLSQCRQVCSSDVLKDLDCLTLTKTQHNPLKCHYIPDNTVSHPTGTEFFM